MSLGKTENNKPHNEHDSDFQSCDSEDSISITQQIEDAIRELPSLEEKVQAIAINYYLLQKRELDEKKQHDITRIQFNIRNSFNPEIQEINAIVEGATELSKEDYEFIIQNKGLLKQGELEAVEKIMKGEEKVEQGQISQYWFRCLSNSDIIAEQIQEPDKEVLKYLYRIQAFKNEDNTKLTISFLFKPNKWFHNQKISKTFTVDKKKEEAEKSTGDQIEWKQGMNYTVTVKSKKNKKNKKVKEEVIREPSFFHFFDSINSKPDDNQQIKDEDEWEELMEDLEIQYELSVHIYEDLIPKSLQFYLNCQPEEEFPVVGEKITPAENVEKDAHASEGEQEK